MSKASAFGGRENIPLPHPPPMASQAGRAQLHRGLLLLFFLIEHLLDENPGYATGTGKLVCSKQFISCRHLLICMASVYPYCEPVDS